MKSSWIGFTIAVGVLYFGVFKEAPNPAIFLDSHAIILVLGGTLAATLIALPLSKLEDILVLLLLGMLSKKKTSSLETAKLILSLTVHKKSILKSKFKHPFFQEALHLFNQPNLSASDLNAILNKRSRYFKQRYLADASALRAIAKFPPAFGLLGASTGMISMMSNIGQGSQDKIGSAMAIALVATFWGIAVANMIILPMADFASRSVLEDQQVRKMIIDGMVLAKSGEEPSIVFEQLLSHLPPHFRDDLKQFVPQNIKPNIKTENVVSLKSKQVG